MKLILFDIDGTLVHTAGAGMRAMARVFKSLYGIDRALEGIPLAGRTDRAIVGDALMRHSPTEAVDATWLVRFQDLYFECLAEELRDDGPQTTVKRVLPGVLELLEALLARDRIALGLLTGNFARAARIKLDYFHLWDYFSLGAFGDASVERNPLLEDALVAAHQSAAVHLPLSGVYVVGDTPHDISCALSGGARAIGVATGINSEEELRQAGADIVFADLSDTFAVLRDGFEIEL